MKTQGLNNRRCENVERGQKKRGKCNTAALKERETQHWREGKRVNEAGGE